jgi:hypothetical protein
MAGGFWHFHCPECGIGDFEFGRLADDQELLCEVCLEEDGVQVRLERWLPQPASYARLRGVLAA